MKIPVVLTVLLTLGLVSLCASAAVLPPLTLEAPASVGKGNAFLARALSGVPVNEFTFTWLGKEQAVKAIRSGNAWLGEILLPVPVDTRDDGGRLAVGVSGGGAVGATVNFHDVKRPVQKLQVDKKYVDPPKAVQQRIKQDRQKVRQALARNDVERQWRLPLYRPVQGGISSQFGLKRVFNGQLRGQHRGLDLRGAEGTPIHACSDGVVVLNDDLYYSGNTVYVNHGDGVFTAYLHMSKSNVQPGQQVRRGDVIGYVGATGRVTGPHLHLSLLVQGQSVDPLPLLEQRIKGARDAVR